MKKISVLTMVIVILAAVPAIKADTYSSGDYLRFCRESVKIYDGQLADRLAAGVCLGYVEGAIGMHYAHTVTDKKNLFYCMPEPGISAIEAISIWIKYLEDNSQESDNKPIVTFVSAMRRAFPCSDPETGK